MSPAGSCENVARFMGSVLLVGFVLAAVVLPVREALCVVALIWACGALWQLGWIDGQRFRIDPWWLLALVGAGGLWQTQAVGPDTADGLMRALAGAGVGLLVGAVPILAAEAVGRRWPFYPGDALLFAAVGCPLGPRGVLWALPVGALAALVRHVCLQRRRGRSWLRGQVALGPGMALGAILVLWAAAVDRAVRGLG